jgi:hypothetical protein
VNRISAFLFSFFFFCLPFQLGKHFWLTESLVLGRKIDYLSPTLYLTDVILGLLVGTIFWQKRMRLTRNVIIILLVLGCLSVISFWTSSYKVISVYYSLKLFELFLLSWIILIKKPTLSEIMAPLSLSTIVVAFLALAQFTLQSSLGGIFYVLGERSFSAATVGIAQVLVNGRLFLRPYSTFPHPNVLAGFLTILLPLWIKVISETTDRKKYMVYVTALAFAGIGIFLSFSRLAWSVGALLLLCLWFKKISLRNRLLLLVLILAVFTVEEVLLGRFISLSAADADSVSERQKLFVAATSMFTSSPLVGIGLGNFIPVLPRFSTPPFLFQPVHSIYALIAAETGSVGFVGFLSLLVLGVYRSARKKNYWISWSLVAVMLLGMFDHYLVTIHQTQFLGIVILSLALF